MEAIEESRTAIVVLSQNYSTSRWCLRELEKIMESMDDGTNRVLPVFYHVDPSHVRHQSGPFERSFVEYENNGQDSQEQVHRWRDAFARVGHLAGVVVNENR